MNRWVTPLGVADGTMSDTARKQADKALAALRAMGVPFVRR
jgi:hypothetical protein